MNKMYAGRFYLCKKCKKKKRIELNFKNKKESRKGIACVSCGGNL